MDKKTIKITLQKAIEKNPYREEIKKVSLFGSYLRGDMKGDSDIDLLIEFYPSARVGFFKLIDIQEALEDILDKEIDLVTPEQLSEYFRSDVLKEAEIVYEK